jgi:prenyl protein peptidase
LLGVPISRDDFSFQSLKAYFIVPALFSGPLYATYLEGSLPFQRDYNVFRMAFELVGDWQGFRNLIMVSVPSHIFYKAAHRVLFSGSDIRRSDVQSMFVVDIYSSWLKQSCYDLGRALLVWCRSVY